MIRVIGGRFRGHKLRHPGSEHTRPVSDRAKEAVFNILGDIEGLQAADLYAGSGAFAVEALSRGAVSAVAVERNPEAAALITANAEDLGIKSELYVVRAPVAQWLLQTNQRFDLVFADPPFNEADFNELEPLAGRLHSNATLVLKHHRRVDPPLLSGLEHKFTRRYATTSVSFYKMS